MRRKVQISVDPRHLYSITKMGDQSISQVSRSIENSGLPGESVISVPFWF